MPPLSIVMPVLDARPWLDAAVASILGQSFGDFEFVIFDDGSTDGSVAALRGWASRDARIRLVEGGPSLGAAGSSAAAVAQARAPIVARMDADDIAYPDRLARQLAVLRGNPDVVLVGAISETIDATGRQVRAADYGRLLRASPFAPFAHHSIMFRSDAYARAGGYRREAERWEDIDLFLRMAGQGRIAVIAAPLSAYRIRPSSTRLRFGDAALQRSMHLMQLCLFGGDAPYAALRRGELTVRSGNKLLPAAITAAAQSRLWGREPVGALRPLLRQARIGWTRQSAAALIWSAWAEASPASLRLFLQTVLALRNARARCRLRGKAWVEWSPPPSVRAAACQGIAE